MAEAAEYGGYDYEFVDKLDPKFYCLVCQDVLCDPQLTGCCGQHYCASCLEQCDNANYDRRCPHCRTHDYATLPNKPLQREINSLKIYCVNRSLGCRWIGELSAFTHHLDSERDGCGFVEVECALKCGVKTQRGQLIKHLHYDCPQRPYECGYCGKEDTYTKITGEKKITKQKGRVPEEKGHYSICPEYPQKCPNQCGKTMKRKEIRAHRLQCHREQVQCQFQGRNTENKILTCGQKMLRSELQHHQKNCPFRTFECKFCHEVSTYAAITGEKELPTHTKQPRIPLEKGHYAECPDYPLFCKHKCHTGEIKRSQMERHLSECPLEPIPCPAREAGCQEVVCRKDLNDHLASNQAQHLTLFCSALKGNRTELESVKGQLDTTTAELDTTRKELSTTTADLSSTRRELSTTTADLSSTRRELFASKAEVDTLKNKVTDIERKLQESSLNTRQELAGVGAELASVKAASRKTEKPATTPPRQRKSFWRKK